MTAAFAILEFAADLDGLDSIDPMTLLWLATVAAIGLAAALALAVAARFHRGALR